MYADIEGQASLTESQTWQAMSKEISKANVDNVVDSQKYKDASHKGVVVCKQFVLRRTLKTRDL